jgi:hypothetical protein
VPAGRQVAEAGRHSCEGEGTEPKPNDFQAGAEVKFEDYPPEVDLKKKYYEN